MPAFSLRNLAERDLRPQARIKYTFFFYLYEQSPLSRALFSLKLSKLGSCLLLKRETLSVYTSTFNRTASLHLSDCLVLL